MKLCEVLKKINILSNLKEGEKIYLSNKHGYILKDGKLYGFDENKNKLYRPKYTKEHFTEIQYNKANDILMNIELVHKLLDYIPNIPKIDLYDSDINVNNKYYSDGTIMSNSTSIKSIIDNHLVLITYWQSDLHKFEMRLFDIDLTNYYMILHILKGNKSSQTMDYYKHNGNLSKKSIIVLDKEINGENKQSTLNTSYDMYFEEYSNLDTMIENINKSNSLKKKKS